MAPALVGSSHIRSRMGRNHELQMWLDVYQQQYPLSAAQVLPDQIPRDIKCDAVVFWFQERVPFDAETGCILLQHPNGLHGLHQHLSTVSTKPR